MSSYAYLKTFNEERQILMQSMNYFKFWIEQGANDFISKYQLRRQSETKVLRGFIYESLFRFVQSSYLETQT